MVLFTPFPGGGWKSNNSFALQVLTGRWFMMFSSFMIMSVSGASYMISLYSREIKSALGYDQSTLNLLSFFMDMGSNIGILSGLINEVSPPWVALLIGGAFNFFGYFMIWLTVTQRIAKPQMWNMCLYIFIGANAHCSTNTGAVVTSVKNFPGIPGIVLGILEGYLGLSAVIVTQLYYAFYSHNSKSLILLIALLPTVTSFVFLPFIRTHRGAQQPNDSKAFYRFLYLTLVLAGFLMIIVIMQRCFTFTQSQYYVTTTLMLLLLILPLGVVIMEEHKIWNSKQQHINCEDPPRHMDTEKPNQVKSAQAPHDDQTIRKRDSFWQNIFKPPDRGEDYTILQAIFSLDMVILFLATLCGFGSDQAMINNLSQIGMSLGYPAHTITTLASLMSIWILLGNIAQGIVSEFIITKYNVPRPLMLTSCLILSCVGNILIALNVPNALYVTSFVIGFSFGAKWPLLFCIISELFGLKYYSTLYNVGGIASPIGTYLLGVKVAGYLYDREATRQMATLGLKRKRGEELSCNGAECYKLAFIIMTAVCLFGAILSLILVLRTREFYKSDVYKKFKEEARIVETNMVVPQDRIGPSVADEGKIALARIVKEI